MGLPQRAVFFTRVRLGACAGAVMLLCCGMCSTAGAQPVVTEFANGLPGSAEPVSITAGAGQLWFGQRGPVGALDTMSLAGGISSHATLNGNQVNAVTLGPEGMIWFSELGGGAKLGMLD